MSGIVVALTVSNTIFLNLAQKYVGAVLPDADPAMIKAAISGTGSDFVKSLSPELQRAVLNAIIKAMSRVYLFVVTTSSLEFLLSFGLKWERVFVEL